MKFACYIMWQFQRTTPRYDTSSQAKSPRTCEFSRGTVSFGSAQPASNGHLLACLLAVVAVAPVGRWAFPADDNA